MHGRPRKPPDHVEDPEKAALKAKKVRDDVDVCLPKLYPVM